MIKWDKDHSDDEFDIENDGHWEPDEDPVDNWPDDVDPDHEFKQGKEFQNWDNEVKNEPSWNEVDNVAYPSSNPVECKPNWSKYEFEDEVWNEHDEPPAEFENW